MGSEMCIRDRAYERLGMQSQVPFLHLLDGMALFAKDAWVDALVEWQASITVAEQTEIGWQLDALGASALAHARLGELEQADELLSRLGAARERGASEFRGFWVPWVRGLGAEARGDLEAGIQPLFEFWQLRVQIGLRYEAYAVAGDLARMLAAADDRERGALVADAVADIAAGVPELVSMQARAMRCRALVSGDPDDLVAAAEVAAAAVRPYESLLGAEAAATSLAEAGRNEEALEWGRRALDAAEQLGAVRDGARIRSALRDAGLRLGARAPHPRARVGWEALTPSELRIAALVSEGLSNPQIAERLVISRRTVSTHVSNILRKLSLSSRVQLAAEASTRRAGPA